jgi:LysM repeat protein
LLFQPAPASAVDGTIRLPAEMPIISDFPLPETLSLCGEPMPLQDQRVFEMLEREFTISVWDHAQVVMWLKRAGRYFPFIEKELAARGMPDDLKYLAVAESSLIDYIRSRAGATGTWQFMSHTARKNGLRHHGSIDERRSFEISTGAALNHLRDLRETFGQWTLAMAAYNCGEACVRKAIKAQRTQDYYRLNLPRETERYVFRIAAIKIIMENPGRYGYRIPAERIYAPLATDTVKVKLSAPVNITDFAEALGSDFKTIKELNPQFLGYYLPRGGHELRVPSGKGKQVKPLLASLSKAAARSPVYTVRRGDSLSKIAARTGVSVAQLMSLNNLKSSVIHKGQKLRLK